MCAAADAPKAKLSAKQRLPLRKRQRRRASRKKDLKDGRIYADGCSLPLTLPARCVCVRVRAALAWPYRGMSIPRCLAR
jgi:hypothetical protein